ncbi:MAG TPA: hypothetical protein PLM79_07800 [Syntrophobacteraceae bacterium]|nr:hypothetical protein [Syntrophobacteraceae bacterium]
MKCGNCDQRRLLPVADQVIYDRPAGKQTIGVYPLLGDDSRCFPAADFEKADWREDAGAFLQSCGELGIPAVPKISRSGNGAHIRISFAEPVPAREARQLGAALISHTCDRTRQFIIRELRPPVPQPGHRAQGRLREPYCALPAEAAEGTGPQCVRR